MTPSPVSAFTAQGLHNGGFAHGATVAADALLFTAGVSPLDDAGTIVEPGDPVGQVRRTLDCLDAILAARGVVRASLVKLTAYVATSDSQVLADVWHALDAELSPSTPPAIVLGVTALPYPGQVVEIEAVAAVPDSGGQ